MKRTLLTAGLWATSLVVAASGTAYAAAKITGAQIKDGTITSADLKNGGVGYTDISRGAKLSLIKEAGSAAAKATPSSANTPGTTGPTGPAGAKGANGTNGANGADGAKGSDSYTKVNAASFTAAGFEAYHYSPAVDGFAAGKIALTGDGIKIGPFANGLTHGAGIKFHALDGKPLTALKSASYEMSYNADNADGKTHGAPYFRVGVKLANNTTDVLVVTAQGGTGAVLTHVPLQDKIRSSGNGGADNNGVYSSIAEVLADARYNGAVINPDYSIRLNLGATNGVNLTGLIRSFEVNGTNFKFTA